MLLKGECEGVICLCWDRISRNEQDGVLIKQLMDKGVDFQFVQVTYDKTSSGALHRDIDGMFANHYSRVISEKVKNTFSKFRADGKCIGPAATGYFDKGSSNKPIDPVRGPIVARIFELYSTGEWSFSQLAKWANKEGLTTKPSRAKRTKEEILSGEENTKPQVSRPCTAKTIENILKNPFYIGKHRTKDNKHVWDCKHPALIDQSLFQKVQEVLVSRNVSVHYVDKEFFTYRGLIRCQCRRSYSPYEQKGITYYRSRCKDGCGNKQVNLTEGDIHKQIASFLSRIHFSEAEIAEIESGAKSGIDKIAAKRESELADLERERKRIYGDLDYLMKNKITLLRNGVSTPEEYAKDVARLEGELTNVRERMNVYQEAAHDMLQYILTFSELVKMASQYYEHALDTEKRELVTQVFSELVFYGGQYQFSPKDGFLALFSRHEQIKKTDGVSVFLNGSGGGIRTHDRLVNSELLYH